MLCQDMILLNLKDLTSVCWVGSLAGDPVVSFLRQLLLFEAAILNHTDFQNVHVAAPAVCCCLSPTISFSLLLISHLLARTWQQRQCFPDFFCCFVAALAGSVLRRMVCLSLLLSTAVSWNVHGTDGAWIVVVVNGVEAWSCEQQRSRGWVPSGGDSSPEVPVWSFNWETNFSLF